MATEANDWTILPDARLDDSAERGTRETDIWTIYLREIGQTRLLTPAEELEMGRRCAAGDRAALEHLVTANLRLVIAVAQRYRHEGLPLHDLVQEGNIGLLRAAQRFDYRKGYRFSTYAIWWIRQAASRAVTSQAYAIRVPVHVQEGLGQAERRLAGMTEMDDGERPDGAGEGPGASLCADTYSARAASAPDDLARSHR